jgi:hypothetical protein
MLRTHNAIRRGLTSVLALIAMLSTVAVAAGPAAAEPPPDWADRGSGCFSTWDYLDYVCYEIRPNAVGQDIVNFRLEDYNRRHWRKTIVMPDGLGSEWPIWVDASRNRYTDQNSLWADQVHNGQRLRFYKAGGFGINVHVMYLGGLERLEPGTQVVFRWLRDSSDN